MAFALFENETLAEMISHEGTITPEHVSKYRKVLCQLINRFLTNLDKVSQDLAKSNQSQCEISFQFIEQCMTSRPEIFVKMPELAKDPATKEINISPQTDVDIGFAVTSWVISRLLRLLATRGCEKLHSRSIDLIVNLLQGVKVKDIVMFRNLLFEFIYSLQDLVKISDKYYDENTPEDFCAELQRFSIPTNSTVRTGDTPTKGIEEQTDIDLTSKLLLLPDEHACEMLQTNITCILSKLALELGQFAGIKLPTLWSTLCCHLEFGEEQLKMVSLDALVYLMQHSGLIADMEVLDYFLSCITGLLELLGQRKDILQGNIAALELSFGKCLITIIHCEKEGLVPALSRSQKEALLTTCCSVLAQQNGAQRFETAELTESVCSTIQQLIEGSNTRMLNPKMAQIKQDIMKAVLIDLGNLDHTQHWVKCLVQLILHELNVEVAPPTCQPSKTTDQSEDSHDSERRDRKRKLTVQDTHSADSGLPDMCQRSSVYKTLFLKLQQLITDKKIDSGTLEGIHTIMTVTSWCATLYNPENLDVSLSQIGNSTTPIKYMLADDTYSLWMSNETLKTVEDMIKEFLQSYVKKTPSMKQPEMTMMYSKIVQMIGTVLFVKDVNKIPGEILQTFTWIISLHWLPNDASWFDLKPHNSRQVAQVASTWLDFISEESVCDCIHLLSLLPKECTPKWRVHVFKMTLTDTRANVRQAGIKAFPLILHLLGPNANHLVYDLLHNLMTDKSPIVLSALATIAGPLACVVSRKAVLQRPLSCKDGKIYCNISLICLCCEENSDGSNVSSPRARPKLVDPAMFLPFLQLLTAARDIKLGLTQSLSKMFGHIEVRSNNQATVNMLNSCLNLIEDPDYQTRVEFSKVVQFLLGDSSSESASETDQLIVTKLAGIMQSHDHVHPHLLETVILTLGQLGRVAEGKLQLVVLISLLKSMISTQPFIAAVAHEQLRDLANHKHVTLQDLFKRHRKSICQFIVDSVYDSEPSSGSGKEPLGILHEVAILFNYDDVKTFLQSTEIYMLPPLVSKATAKASALIKLIASQLDKTKRQCLTRNTAYIFSYLLCFCQGRPGQYDKALHFLRQETGLELGSLLRLDMQNVENELLLHLSDNYTQMFKGLSMVASYDELEYKGPKDIKTKDQMAAFLQPRLLGFLAYFDSKFLNKTIPWEEKLMALESLISLMKMMGAHYITPVRVKLMATLKIVLRFKEKAFPSVCCRAWECFVKSLDMASLGPMLSQIIVILLPLFNQLPNQVAEIFRFLIVKNRVQLEPHFHELYFMPESRELADINEVLAKFTAGHSKRASLQIQISHLLNGVSHESLDVRLRALKKLRQLLHTHQVELHYMVMGKETSDPVISQLVSALLSGCRESDPTARNLVGECLGELGAVDPGRLDLNVNDDNKDMAKFHADVNDDNYGYDLINELVRAFLAAENTETQDCSAYALQEIASVYGISNTAGNHTAGKKLWLRFPGHIQEILVPLLHSKYKVTSSENWSQVPKVIYGSHKGKYFEKWISTWTGYLITMVKDTKASMIFKSCSVVVKHDHNTALYLLPNIIVQALIDGTANQTQQISNEVLAVLNDVKQPDTQQGMASDFRHLAAQTIFSILGMVVKWQRHRIQYLSAIAAQHKNRSGNNHENDGKYKAVKQFIDKIPLDILASASFNCQAYTRSLMYFEQFINMKKENIHQHLDFFQKLYIAMDEPDGVASVIAIREDQPTLTEQILAHESIGQLRDASACYERAIQQDNNCISHYEGLIKCQMELGQFETAACQVDGILTKKPEWHGTMNSYRVEAAWKLGQWDNLRTHLDQERGKRTWAVGIGNTLMLAKDRDEEGFLQQLQIVRSELMGPLSAASMEKGSYQRGYEYIVRLHMLNELEQGVRELLHFPTRGPQERSGLAKLIELWDSRLSLTQASFRMKEPILNLRRTLFSLAEGNTDVDLHTEIGKSWLRSAKVARKVGHLQTAFSFLLNGSSYHLPELFVERAKWFWAKNDHDLAQTCIEKGLQEFYPDCTLKDNALRRDTTEKGLLRRIECAKALLLWGMYSEETSSIESNEIVKRYRDVIDMNPTWEDGHFYLAKYYDKIMVHLTNSDRPDRQRSILEPIIENYGKALRNGSQYIYQTMPRMLTIWLEYGSKMVESESKQNKNETAIGQQRFTLQTMNESIAKLGNELPPYTFLTAFPQLISRICHPHNMVFQVLSELISNMMHNYPQQAMWLMMAVSKSSYKIRQSRCHTIIAKARQKDKSLNKFIHDAIKLADRLLDLCNRHVESGQNVFSISQHFKPLQRLMDDVDFSKIIIPLQTMMNVTLPTTSGPHSEHDPFPMEQVYIDGFDDTVEVLPSLQKPKKITMKGSDGKRYVMMCKPKDDLRKDCRLMEFNSIVNKCLRKDPESRKRQLHIRTYTVVPLNEECGLLEWVFHTQGLRPIIMKLWKERGVSHNFSYIRSVIASRNSKLEEKMRVYKTKLLPRHPPVFKEWFLKTFPDPTSWYMARQSYARTTAVMSMVGYILGLGDRHGENILFDSTNGDVVHVDFNCLFNKGDTFDWPELVPFRLTRNMVDAMGPMGYEGLFRRACEVTMRVMRDQMDPLMSVLKTFIFDPLVEWAGKPTKGRSNSSETGEIKNDQAQMNVQNIECRMKGELKANKHKRSRGLPLSIEGHVNHLIKESTKDENLCAMYIGWAAYM